MSVKIRLSRVGGKKKPFYRVVVADSNFQRDGRFIDVLGTYDPSKNPHRVEIDGDRANSWIAKGAIPTDTVKVILKKAGISGKSQKAA